MLRTVQHTVHSEMPILLYSVQLLHFVSILVIAAPPKISHGRWKKGLLHSTILPCLLEALNASEEQPIEQTSVNQWRLEQGDRRRGKQTENSLPSSISAFRFQLEQFPLPLQCNLHGSQIISMALNAGKLEVNYAKIFGQNKL